MPAGLCSDDFEKHQQAIEQFVGRRVEIKYTYKEIWIEVYKNQPKTYYSFEPVNCHGFVAFPIGYDLRRKVRVCDLTAGQPHLLIAGETGGGKSTCLRGIIVTLILFKSVTLHLIDLKGGVELQMFSKCKKVKAFARTREETYAVLDDINREVGRRYDKLYENNCTNIAQYNRNGGRNGI